MSKTKLQLIANSYASALLELACEKKSAEALYEAFKKQLTFLENVYVKKVLDNPLLSKKDQENLVKLFDLKGGSKDLMIGLIRTLSSYSKLALLPLVAKTYCDLYREQIGECEITLISAQAFSPAQEKSLVKKLEPHFNKKIFFNKKIQESLLAGFVLEFAGKRIDLSLKGNLKQFSNHGSIR